MPQPLRTRIEENLGLGIKALALRFGRARQVQRGPRIDLWLVEGSGVTCIFDSSTIASACDSRINAGNRGLYIQTYDQGRSGSATPVNFVVVGLAPEEVSAIRAEVDGLPIAIPVREGAFTYRSDTPVRINLPK